MVIEYWADVGVAIRERGSYAPIDFGPVLARQLFLIDGNSLVYRAFFALPTDMSTAAGQVTNAVFGFTSMLINLMRDHGSGRVAVAFDRPEPTFRHERVDTYKANRDAAPDILRQQIRAEIEAVPRGA